MSGQKNSLFCRLLSPSICLLLLIGCYLVIIWPFADYMQHKPVVEKIGVYPKAEVLQFVSADQKPLLAASLVMKVMMYFGGLMEDTPGKYKIPPDYLSMSRLLHGAVKLDPYNMDAYYFAQAFLVWDVGAYKLANDLMIYGMKYRNWDWYLPFFAGFNSAYFLKDYEGAAKYYRLTADLSGQSIFSTLAGRYMQKSGQTTLALAYLVTMEKNSKTESVKKLYKIRIDALKAVREIEVARDTFLRDKGRLPETVTELVQQGYLTKHPAEPYGGKFYFEPDGTVSTTSDFTFGKLKK